MRCSASPKPHFMRATGATFKLATEHLGWQGEGSRFLHAHGEIGADIGRARRSTNICSARRSAGSAERPEDFLRRRRRRAARHGSRAPRARQRAHVEFHLWLPSRGRARTRATCAQHRAGARRARRRCAAGRGRARRTAAISRAARWPTGRRSRPTCYVDCSGPEARLMSASRRARATTGRPGCPAIACGRRVAPPLNDPPAVTQTMAGARRLGLARAARRTRRMVGHVYSQPLSATTTARADAAAPSRRPACEPRARRPSRRAGARNSGCATASRWAPPPSRSSRSPAPTCTSRRLGIANVDRTVPAGARQRQSRRRNTTASWPNTPTRCAISRIAHYRAGPARAGEFWAATRATPLPRRGSPTSSICTPRADASTCSTTRRSRRSTGPGC